MDNVACVQCKQMCIPKHEGLCTRCALKYLRAENAAYKKAYEWALSELHKLQEEKLARLAAAKSGRQDTAGEATEQGGQDDWESEQAKLTTGLLDALASYVRFHRPFNSEVHK